jgi:hypothetical protein
MIDYGFAGTSVVLVAGPEPVTGTILLGPRPCSGCTVFVSGMMRLRRMIARLF